MKRKNKKKSLTSKMVSLMITICIIGVAIIVAISTTLSGKSLLNETLEHIKSKTETETEKIENWLSTQVAYFDAATVAINNMSDYSEEKLRPVLQAFSMNHPEFFDVYIGFPDGTGIFGSDWQTPDTWLSYERPWYKDAVKNISEPCISSLYTDAQTGQMCVSISKALIDEQTGTVKSVLSADIFITTLQNTVLEANILKGSYAFVTNSSGDILIHPNSKYAPVYDSAADEDIFKNLTEIENGIFSKLWQNSADNNIVKVKGADGVLRFYSSYVIPSTGWAFYIAVPSGIIYAPVYELLLVMIPISLLFIIILVFVSSKIVKSIDKVLKKAAVQLRQSTNDVTNTAIELTESSNNLAKSGSEQAASIQETSAAMNQTASMVEMNTRNTQHALLLTKETSDETATGMQKIKNLISFMDELSKSSHAISNVINTISGIASQTNILALNASVESARAGEAGKAFSVVSEEVRALAQKCNDAVRSTSEILEHNVRSIYSGIANSHEVRKAFDVISSKIEKVNQIVDEITTASEEQSKGVKYVNDTLSQMEEITQSNALISEESASAANDLKSQSVILQELADNINNLVGQSSEHEEEPGFASSRYYNAANSPLTANE